jgi:hypothetical protein
MADPHPSNLPVGDPRIRPILPATESQVKALWAIARGVGVPEPEVRAHLQESYGTSEPGQLTRRQASEAIDWLKTQ